MIALYAILVLSAVAAMALMHGEYAVPVLDVLAVLAGYSRDPVALQIVLGVRLPRVALGIVVGVALGMAGVVAQSVLRNPLGEPGLLGVNSGAALLVTVLVVLLPFGGSPDILALGAFAGALSIAAAIYGLSTLMDHSPTRLVLVGVGLGALAGGLATGVSLMGDVETAQRLMTWLAGSLYDSNWPKIASASQWLVLPALGSLLLSRDLDVLVLGEETAMGLGLSVPATRAIALALCALLAAISVTAAGPIAFVGLIAPHAARRLGARHHRALLPISGLVGALIVVSADLLGRIFMPPIQLPVGFVVPLVGAPLLGAVIVWRRLRPRMLIARA